MAATSGVAALVPTTAPQPPCVDEYSAIPPPLPAEGVNSAAAETSFVARLAQALKADGCDARNAV